MKTWWTLVKASISSWIDDYAPSMGAALSYYTVFSLAPLLLIVVSVAGLVFGEDAVRGELFAQLQGLMGADAAKAVQSLLASVNKPTQGIVGTVVGIALLVFGATTVFGELQDALDRIWRAPARAKGGGLWALASIAAALVRDDPRPRVPAHGLARHGRGDLGARQVVGAGIRRLGDRWRRSSTCSSASA